MSHTGVYYSITIWQTAVHLILTLTLQVTRCTQGGGEDGGTSGIPLHSQEMAKTKPEMEAVPELPPVWKTRHPLVTIYTHVHMSHSHIADSYTHTGWY